MLTSELLSTHGFRHGFSLRGVDEAELAAAVGYPPERLLLVTQVHGAAVQVVGPDDAREAVREVEADALVAPPASPEVAVGVRVADCIPLLLADPVTGAVAAVHAGWRGTVARVVDAAIDQLVRHAKVRPTDLLAAIGPHIRVEAFEVGGEVAEQIEAEAHGADVVHRGYAKPHVDLAAVVRAQLVERGLVPEHVDDVGGCTHSDPARFHSYRRDGARSGRLLGVIVAGR